MTCTGVTTCRSRFAVLQVQDFARHAAHLVLAAFNHLDDGLALGFDGQASWACPQNESATVFFTHSASLFLDWGLLDCPLLDCPDFGGCLALCAVLRPDRGRGASQFGKRSDRDDRVFCFRLSCFGAFMANR